MDSKQMRKKYATKPITKTKPKQMTFLEHDIPMHNLQIVE